MAREIPLLQEIITSIIDSNRYKNNTNDLNILDLGCGPGKHIQELSSLFPDISFLGIDIDPEMIKSALDKNKNNLRVDFAIGDIFNRDFSKDKKYDFIYSLGNSFSLIWGADGPKKLIQILSEVINPNGKLFFQILNSESPRDGYIISNLNKNSYDYEIFTLKRFSADNSKKIMNVEFLNFSKNQDDLRFSFDIKKSEWKMVSQQEIINILQKNKFYEIQFWANYSKEPFSNKKSDNILYYVKKLDIN